MDLKIKVKTDELIRSLKDNRESHKKEYAEAHTTYFNRLRDELSNLLREANHCLRRDDNYRISLQPPVDQSIMYDKYIRMLEMSIEPEIEIGVDEYTKFVEDQWDWAISAKLMNSRYLGH